MYVCIHVCMDRCGTGDMYGYRRDSIDVCMYVWMVHNIWLFCIHFRLLIHTHIMWWYECEYILYVGEWSVSWCLVWDRWFSAWSFPDSRLFSSMRFARYNHTQRLKFFEIHLKFCHGLAFRVIRNCGWNDQKPAMDIKRENLHRNSWTQTSSRAWLLYRVSVFIRSCVYECMCGNDCDR